MKLFVVAGLIGTTALAGCQTPIARAPAAGPARDRYVGVGLYHPGDLWRQVVRTKAPTDPAAAKLEDDDQIIVVLDSARGELRQCGNLSGYCVAMNPWANAPGAGAPVPLLKHAQQLADEAAAALEAAAAKAKPTAH